jgi:TRAP transporter TAXI family solute receptor
MGRTDNAHVLSIRRTLAAITALLMTSASCAPRVHHVAKSKPVIRLMTGTPGGGFYPLGQSLAAAYRRDVVVEHRESPGSVNNVLALQTGGAEVALAYADVAYFAFAGTLEGHPERFDRLRGMAVLQRAPVHLVARAVPESPMWRDCEANASASDRREVALRSQRHTTGDEYLTSSPARIA